MRNFNTIQTSVDENELYLSFSSSALLCVLTYFIFSCTSNKANSSSRSLVTAVHGIGKKLRFSVTFLTRYQKNLLNNCPMLFLYFVYQVSVCKHNGINFLLHDKISNVEDQRNNKPMLYDLLKYNVIIRNDQGHFRQIELCYFRIIKI